MSRKKKKKKYRVFWFFAKLQFVLTQRWSEPRKTWLLSTRAQTAQLPLSSSELENGEVTQGGSTITQQLARTIFLTQDRTWQRKVEEMFIATELEKKYSKNKILADGISSYGR